MRTEILAFIACLAICLIGGVALAVYALRFRSKERDLLWIGLFAILYGADLLLHNPVFQLGFGSTRELARFAPRILSACSIVPALLLFQEFYGRGWRSLLPWMTVAYGVVASGAYGYAIVRHVPGFMPSAGVALVICVPAVLLIGYIAGYQPPRLDHAPLLFAGLISFFVAFSADHLRNFQDGQWRPGLEPYGFIILLACLSYVATQRVLADERRLISLNDEMHAAAAIQASILPRSVPALGKARVAVRYAPVTAVAGDFYDFPDASPQCLNVLLADVMGHGVPAALVASMVKVAVRTHAGEGAHPGKIIRTLNSILCDVAAGQYVTGVYLHLDFAAMEGIYAAAAHPPPLLWSRSRRQLIPLKGDGLLLGVRRNESYGDFHFRPDPGDRLLLYTDGLTEAENANGDSFGEALLPQFFEQHETDDIDSFAERLQQAVRAWSASGKRGQTDDITFVLIDFPSPE